MLPVRRALAGIAAFVAVALPARAQGTLSGFLNVDNAFTAFLSTSPALTGAVITSGSAWTVTNPFSGVALQAGQDYWFQVRARDEGVIAGLLATLTITGGTHVFANGTATLTSNTTDWLAGTSDWAADPQSLVSYGTNGVSPWGTFAQQSSSAQWIWTADNCINCTRFLSTRITATPAIVPEPGTVVLLATGLVALPFVRRRRSA